MAIFAVLQHEQIVNVIVADTKENAELATNETCVEIPEGVFAGIGWSYKDGEFISPVVPTIEDSNSVV